MNRSAISDILRALARISFSITIFLIPFRARVTWLARPQPPLFPDYTDFQIFASDILLVATLALWLCALVLARRRISFAPRVLTLPIAGITAAGIVSIVSSVDRDLSIYHSVRLLMLFGMYLFIVNEIRSIGEIILPIALQVFVQAAVGMGQVLQQHSLGLSQLGELSLDPARRGISTVWSGTAISLRPYGLTDHPNILGGSLAFALLFIAIWYVDAKSEWRIPTVGLFGLSALALLLTFSRAAWLALGAGTALTIALLVATRQARAVTNWLALIAAAVIFVAPFAWQNAGYLDARLNPNEPSMFTGENRAVVERNSLNTATLAIFQAHPLLGTGLGTVPFAIRAAYPSFPFDYQPAHIVLLNVAAETGIVGALFYFAALLAPWLALWLNRRRLRWSPALIGISGVLLAVTLVGFFDYYTWLLVPGRLWQWLIWGLWSAAFSNSLSGAMNV
jgi:hypothetical protein